MSDELKPCPRVPEQEPRRRCPGCSQPRLCYACGKRQRPADEPLPGFTAEELRRMAGAIDRRGDELNAIGYPEWSIYADLAARLRAIAEGRTK